MANDSNQGEQPPEAVVTSDRETPSGFAAQLLDRAQKAREQAQSSVSDLVTRAGEVKDQAATTAATVTLQATAKAAAVKDDLAAKAGELKDASLTKLGETLDDFNATLPFLREAGYTLTSVDVGIGLPPKVSASFVASDGVSLEGLERLIAEHGDKKLTVLLVKALHQAWQVQTKIQIAGLKPRGISVEIGLIPVVSVKFA